MLRRFPYAYPACLLAAGLLWAGGPAAACAEDELSFHRDVLPIFKAKCLRCHHPQKKDGQLDLSTYKALMAGGKSGPVVVPGKSRRSLLIDTIFFGEMPPKNVQPRVTPAELKTLEQWVDAGAPEGDRPEPSSGQGAAP